MPGLSGEVFLTRSKSQQPAEFEPHLRGSRCTSTDLSIDTAVAEEEEEVKEQTQDEPVEQESSLRQRLRAKTLAQVSNTVPGSRF